MQAAPVVPSPPKTWQLRLHTGLAQRFEFAQAVFRIDGFVSEREHHEGRRRIGRHGFVSRHPADPGRRRCWRRNRAGSHTRFHRIGRLRIASGELAAIVSTRTPPAEKPIMPIRRGFTPKSAAWARTYAWPVRYRVPPRVVLAAAPIR